MKGKFKKLYYKILVYFGKGSNKKVFEALKKKYEKVSLAEIENMYLYEDGPSSFRPFFGLRVGGKLTGFGDSETCTLCQSVGKDCLKCYWMIKTGAKCFQGNNHDTYYQIYNAQTPGVLYRAFKDRASIMEKIL